MSENPGDSIAESSAAQARALSLVAELRHAIEGRIGAGVDIRAETRAERFVRAVAVAVLGRCADRAAGIARLLAGNLHEEASTLLRSLSGDSMRLLYIERHREDRVALTLGWWSSHVNEVAKIAKAAARTGQRGPDLIDAWVERERRQLQLDEAEFGVERLRLPDEGANLARAVHDPDSEMDYLLATNPSHTAIGSIFAWAEKQPDGSVRMQLSAPDAASTVAIASRAAHHYANAAIAALRICGVDTAPFEELSLRLEKAFEELAGSTGLLDDPTREAP